MAIITYSWLVERMDEVLALFDVQRVFRGEDPEGPWTEITTVGTRVPLVAGVTTYVFTDTSGMASYYYCSDYFHSGTSESSGKSSPIRGDMAGYISIDEVRDEGFDEEEFPDDQVLKAITKASDMIDRVTRRFFEPREMTIKIDGDGEDRVEFGHPLIALLSIEVDGVEINTSELVVYNRHLTQNLVYSDRDDRKWPRIEMRKDWQSSRTLIGAFDEGQQNVKIHGYFGYTEIGPGDPVGETEEGSQVPQSYGDTPELIKHACLLLVMQYIYPVTDGDGDEFRMRMNVVRMKTRDQEIEYNKDTSEGLSSGYLTGDPVVDKILASFIAPSPMVTV